MEVIRRVRTMPEQKVKSMLAQEVDPRKALLTLDLELIESVTATDQERRYIVHKLLAIELIGTEEAIVKTLSTKSIKNI